MKKNICTIMILITAIISCIAIFTAFGLRKDDQISSVQVQDTITLTMIIQGMIMFILVAIIAKDKNIYKVSQIGYSEIEKIIKDNSKIIGYTDFKKIKTDLPCKIIYANDGATFFVILYMKEMTSEIREKFFDILYDKISKTFEFSSVSRKLIFLICVETSNPIFEEIFKSPGLAYYNVDNLPIGLHIRKKFYVSPPAMLLRRSLIRGPLDIIWHDIFMKEVKALLKGIIS